MADDECAARRGEQHARTQVDVGQHAQRLLQPGRQLHRLEQHQILQRAMRADRSAESSSAEQREHERQDEERADRHRHRIAAVAQAERDVLQGADGADAALAPESEVEHRENGERHEPFARARLIDQPASEPEASGEHRHVQVLEVDCPSRRNRGSRHLVSALEIRWRETLLREGDTGQQREEHEAAQPGWPFAIGQWRFASPGSTGARIAHSRSQIAERGPAWRLAIGHWGFTRPAERGASGFCLLPSSFFLHISGWSSSADRADRPVPGGRRRRRRPWKSRIRCS